MDKNVRKPDPVSEAMQRVLAAERDSERALALAQAEAEEILAEARQGARNIRRRVNERIRRMQGAYTRATEAHLAGMLEAAKTTVKPESASIDDRALFAAVARLTAKLTGPEHDPSP